jgi:hypothetical protein
MSKTQHSPDNIALFNGLPVYISTVDERAAGIEFNSLVASPAVQYTWQAYSAEKPIPEKQFFADTERRIITGVAMLADTPIYRVDRDKAGNITKEYYTVFPYEETEKILKMFVKNGRHNYVNVDHKRTGKVAGVDAVPDGLYLFELIFVDSKRGVSAPSAFSEVPDGSIITSYYVESDEVWNNLVKDGVVLGFSVEGEFLMYPKEKQQYSAELALIESIQRDITAIEQHLTAAS